MSLYSTFNGDIMKMGSLFTHFHTFHRLYMSLYRTFNGIFISYVWIGYVVHLIRYVSSHIARRCLARHDSYVRDMTHTRHDSYVVHLIRYVSMWNICGTFDQICFKSYSIYTSIYSYVSHEKSMIVQSKSMIFEGC